MKLNIDWAKVESCFKYAAMDADGDVFLYEDCPLPSLRTEWACSGGGGCDAYLGEVLSTPNWKETLTERPQKEIEVSKSNKVHPHAAIIADAIKDTSRQIEGRYTKHGKWIEISLDDVVNASGAWKFRFADTEPKVTSPLTDDELRDLWTQPSTATNPAERMRDLKRVAIAVKVATIKEVANMPHEYCPDEGISEMYGTMFGQSLRPQDKQPVTEFAQYVWVCAVTRFQAQLLKLIGE